MTKHRIAVIVGTRPEAIKMAPVIKALRAEPDRFDTLVVSTAQHRQMVDQIFSRFGIVPDMDLDLMRPDQQLGELTARALTGVKTALDNIKPDVLLVQGDTTTVLAAALAAFYAGVPVGHVEAGLRSHDMANPYPEEANRRLTSVLASLHFAPTELARQNLLNEGIPDERIVVTGNTVVDALLDIAANEDANDAALPGLDPTKRLVLVTSHRRESHGKELDNICMALLDIVERCPDVQVVYPVHPNPNVRKVVMPRLKDKPGILLTEPLDYFKFVALLRRAYLILTDSGGIQEEAPTFGVPVLVLRGVTERPEAARIGLSRVIGTERDVIRTETLHILKQRKNKEPIKFHINPYGDGKASARIIQKLLVLPFHQ